MQFIQPLDRPERYARNAVVCGKRVERTVRPENAQVLIDYLHEVQGRTTTMLAGLGAEDLDRVVDRRWDPPVTLGVRLVSVADDALQHAGQAAYVRGLLEGREGRAS